MINALFKGQGLLPGTCTERSQRHPPSCGGSVLRGTGGGPSAVGLCWEKAPLSSERWFIFDPGFKSALLQTVYLFPRASLPSSQASHCPPHVNFSPVVFQVPERETPPPTLSSSRPRGCELVQVGGRFRAWAGSLHCWCLFSAAEWWFCQRDIGRSNCPSW